MHRQASHHDGHTHRGPQRKEWDRFSDHDHQCEAAHEHARVPVRARRTEAVRSAEAAHQIRELRERY